MLFRSNDTATTEIYTQRYTLSLHDALPIIDRSYSYALIVSFANDADHETYQVHPVHDRFREQCGGSWKKIVIYDAVSA